MPEKVLFNRETPGVIRSEIARGRLILIGIVAPICGALVAVLHQEYPFLAYWLGACSPLEYAYKCGSRVEYGVAAGLLFAAVFFGLFLLFARVVRIPATVTCRGCGRCGWVRDIEPGQGRCPHCGGERFDYRIWRVMGVRPSVQLYREEGVSGAFLVQRYRETRKSVWERFI